VVDVRGKGNYQLRYRVTQLDYLTTMTQFECGPGDANVAAFAEETSIIGGRNTMEEFLACDIWPLSEKCEFEVEMKETPLSKVMVHVSKVTPDIGN
jgi:hypothetical protein